MKKIAITQENAFKIETLLTEVNGKGYEYCFISYDQIERLVIECENLMSSNGVPKNDRQFAWIESISGRVVKNWGVTRTYVSAVRGKKQWYLEKIEKVSGYNGVVRHYFTAQQSETMLDNFRASYSVVGGE